MKVLPDLHRAGAVPDWELVPESEWNEHQRRAAETGGWDTPGNRTTLKGVAATLTGLALINADTRVTSVIGTAFLGYGRYLDLRDGRDSDKTGTKSSLGEGVDAGADVLLLFAAGLVLRRKKIVPKDQIDPLMIIKGVKMVATGVAKARGRETHPGATGKHGVFGEWSGVGFDSISYTAEHFKFDGVAQKTSALGSLGLHIGTGMGYISAGDYLRNAFSSHKPVTEPVVQ